MKIFAAIFAGIALLATLPGFWLNVLPILAQLGKIAVLGGRWIEGLPFVDVWVLSCRAFSRRIEHQTLRACFEKLGCEQLQFDFQTTNRNGPVRDLFQTIGVLPTEAPAAPLSVTRAGFLTSCPSLFAKVISHDSVKLGSGRAA